MKKIFIYALCIIFITNCVVVDSIKNFSQQHCISRGSSSAQSTEETLNKDVTQFKAFVQTFFSDTIYQRKHVYIPLVFNYSGEQDADDSVFEQNTILIDDNDYQILILDARCEIKIIENEGKEPYVVVSIPDTALEAELYFKKDNGTYLLNKINITGDASPFI